jgi:zinc protease
MRRIPIPFIAVIAAALAWFPAGADEPGIPSSPSQIVYGPLDWTVPLGSPYRETLKNGLRAYIAVDSQLPLVEISAYFRWGALKDPAGKEGACSLLGKLMKTGGTAAYSPDSIDAVIDRYALRINVSSAEDLVELNASFLSDFSDTAFAVIKQILFSPKFDGKELDKEKKIFIENIRHRFDNPGPTLDQAYQKNMYAGSPAARMATEQSINRIKQADLIRMHRQAISTGNCIFSIAGKFDRAAMASSLETLFPPAGPVVDTGFPMVAAAPAVKCLVVHKPISQAYVRFGLPLFKRPNPDYYPVSLANFILGGGGFTSRLGTKVRSNAGLTYSIHAGAASNYTYPGTWYVDFFTKSETFGKATALSLAVIRDLRANGITDEELAHARETLIGGLPSTFRSPFDIVATYGWNEYYGRSPLHFQKYADDLGAITKEDVLRVLTKYLDPAAFTYTIVGDTASLRVHGTDGDFDFAKLAPQKIIAPDALPLLP